MTSDLVPTNIDQERVLATLGLNMRDPKAQGAVLVCQRYDLDPLLKHVQLIQNQIYITRDGFLHVGHRSGVFDGMEVVDEGETETYFWAKVSVWRKDMSRPFTSTARCKKGEKVFGDPWDMAITRAERRALKRAFDVAGLPGEGDYDEHQDLYDHQTGEARTPVHTATAKAIGPAMDAPLPDEPLESKIAGGGGVGQDRERRAPSTVAASAEVRVASTPVGANPSTEPPSEEVLAASAPERKGDQPSSTTEGPLEGTMGSAAAGTAHIEPAAAPTISAKSMKEMQALFSELGITDAQSKRDYCAQVLGHSVASATHLLETEARTVIVAQRSQKVLT